jgi:hypothetical protein
MGEIMKSFVGGRVVTKESADPASLVSKPQADPPRKIRPEVLWQEIDNRFSYSGARLSEYV